MSFPSHLEDKYELLSKLAEGGMGDVYTARHRLLGEVRVIKVMRRGLRGDPQLADRFLREARVASRLRHGNIAQIFDYTAEHGEDAAIVMEHIDGSTLEELCRSQPLPIALTLEIARQTLEALDYLHSKGFVHRDISPDNIMLELESGRPRVRLIDMGIAKALEAEASKVTAVGSFVGKVRYCSPEQLAARGELDGRSDLYSFGVVLYELLTGRCPIRGETPPTLIAGHLFRPPMSFEDSDPGGQVPSELRQLVLKALAKDPNHRMPDARAFNMAIVALQHSWPLGEGVAAGVMEGVGRSSETTSAGRTWPKLVLSESVPEREKILAALARGLRLAEIGRYDEARECVAEAQIENAEVEQLVARLKAEIDRAESMQQQAVVVTSTLASVEGMLAEGRLDDAEARVAEGEQQSEAGPFSALRDRVERQRTEPAFPQPANQGLGKVAVLFIVLVAMFLGAWFFYVGPQKTADVPVELPSPVIEEPVATPPQGVLVVDALPWAEVVSLENAAGERLELPTDASTPLRLELPVGSYQLMLSDDQGLEPRALSVEVSATGVEYHTVAMRVISIDAFFEAQGY